MRTRLNITHYVQWLTFVNVVQHRVRHRITWVTLAVRYLMMSRGYQSSGCIFFFVFVLNLDHRTFLHQWMWEKIANKFGRYAGWAVGDETSGALTGVFVSWRPKRGDSGNSAALLSPLSDTANSAFLSVRCILVVCVRYSTSSTWHHQLCENYINCNRQQI